jgi:hypothetical protein
MSANPNEVVELVEAWKRAAPRVSKHGHTKHTDLQMHRPQAG